MQFFLANIIASLTVVNALIPCKLHAFHTSNIQVTKWSSMLSMVPDEAALVKVRFLT